MPLPTDLKLIQLYDAKISKLTADSGASPTYDTGVDIPGIVKIMAQPKMEMKELKGDGAILDVYSRVVSIDVEVECAKLPLLVLPIIQGGTTTAGGVTPNQTQTYALALGSAGPSYFKLEGVWDYAGDGIADAHLVVYKIKCTEPPAVEVQDANGDFGKVTFKGMAVPYEATGRKFMEIIGNETASPIA